MSNSAKDRRALIKNDQVEQLKRMVEIREFEEICFNLFAEGLIRGTTHLCNGQEAVAVGIASSLEVTDYVMCTYRGHGHALALGMTPETVLSEIMGKSGGSMFGLGGSMHLSDLSVGLLPTSAIVGAGIPIATGVAKSAQYKKTGAVAVSIFGDGAANIGAFHEGLNIAKVLNLPAIFICENNLYGEYSPLANTTSVLDLATRAKAYDMRNYIVDGQEIEEVIETVGEAVEFARNGEGPTFIEMKTYRYSGHSRSDPASYRPEGELEAWMERDPIKLLNNTLVSKKALTTKDLDKIIKETNEKLNSVKEKVSKSSEPTEDYLFKNIYSE
tara:strand:+ start:71 stop:1057 length:987 start_codon:yes stop_codon:yes gene_type:complete